MTEFHKVWIDQCEAAEGIRERYGVPDAARYLIGEKLLNFMEASQTHPEWAAELPHFAARTKELFAPHEIVAFFDAVEAGEVMDPVKVFMEGIRRVLSSTMSTSCATPKGSC